MCSSKSTRTQLPLPDIHVSDDTVRAAASTAKRATSTVLSETGIDNDYHDDYDLYDPHGGETYTDSPIDNESADLHSQPTEEDRLEVATQTP